jgi:archaellum biogenesis ATPase FlaH
MKDPGKERTIAINSILHFSVNALKPTVAQDIGRIRQLAYNKKIILVTFSRSRLLP